MYDGIVSTKNLTRIWSALHELEQRLVDPERMGVGIVYGAPGRGKTVAAETYHSIKSEDGEIETFWVRAKPIWTPAAMIRDILLAVGVDSQRRGANDLLDELREHLKRRPGIILLDDVDRFIRKQDLVQIIKYLHDTTMCAFLLIGETGAREVIKRYLSFERRLNDLAIVEVESHPFVDVCAVIRARCEFPVSEDVCREIYKDSEDMGRVVRKCRHMKVFIHTNELQEMDLNSYRAMLSRDKKKAATVPPASVAPLALAATGGGHA
jgi:hypothetical protein